MTSNTHPPAPSDETLVAYADNRLGDEEARDVERYFAVNPEARELVDALRRSADLASSAFDGIMTAPVPDRLLRAALGESQPVRETAKSAVVVPFRDRKRTVFDFSYPSAIAATLLLAVGTFAGYQLAGPRGNVGPVAGLSGAPVAIGPVPATSQLASVLETRESNSPAEISFGPAAARAEVMVLATFVDRNGRFCREFEAAGAASADQASDQPAPITAAIACRNRTGTWSIEGAIHLAGGDGPSIGGFNPASGKSVSAIEAVLAALGAKPVMSADDEKRILERGWRQGG